MACCCPVCAVDPAIDFADGHLCRALRGRRWAPYAARRFVPVGAGLGQGNEAFEVSRSADHRLKLKGNAAVLFVGYEPGALGWTLRSLICPVPGLHWR